MPKASFVSRFFLSLASGFLFLSGVQAQEVPPGLRYVTLKSAHFDLMVNAEQQELGAYYLSKFEQADALLRTIFTHSPERVTVVIADSTDQTNGYATRIPYPHIVLFPVLPNALDSLGESGDWVLELCAHELTHIYTFETVTGPFDTLQSIFGTIMSPNLLLPRWWKEGVAVEVETRVAQGGRLRSAYQDGVLRSLEKDNRLRNFDLPQINEILPDWPEGLRPYMFGSLIWSEAVAQKGVGIIDHLHREHGGRFPFFLNGTSEDALGLNYNRFFETSMARLRYQLQMQILQLETVASTNSTELLSQYKYLWSAEISPDGQRMAAIAEDVTAKRFIVFLNRNSDSGLFELEKPHRNPEGLITRLSWMPDSRRIVFDKIETYSRQEHYSDLWIFDTDERKATQLTSGLRAREPIVKRDGTGVFFVGLKAATTHLGFFDFAKKSATTLNEFKIQERADWPTLTSEGDLIFSLRTGDGRESLQQMSAAGGEPHPLLVDYPNARFPRMTSSGLLFTSSRNGIHNVYRATPTMDSASPLTHVLGGVLSFDFDEKTQALYATVLTSKGPRVHRISQEESARLQSELRLPAVGPLLAKRYTQPLRPAHPLSNDMKFETEDYSPWSYLWPRYWIPLVGVSSVNNSVAVVASTSGFDPLKRHIYSLMGEWDFGTNQPSYLLTYQNNSWSTSMALVVQRASSYLGTQDHVITTDLGVVALTPDLFKFSKYFSASLAWNFSRRKDISNTQDKSGPMLSALYMNFARTGEQISPESGGSVYASAADYLPGGERLSFKQYLLATNYYFSVGLPARHALALRTAGVYTPEKVSSLQGGQSTPFIAKPEDPQPNFVIRGYRVGHFLGTTMANGTLEYRFPVREIRRGHGTDPFFITRLHGAVFVDALGTDGFAYHVKDENYYRVGTDRIFSSMGVEARLETNLGYAVPLNVIAGYVIPSHKDFSDGWSPTLALQIGALF